MSHKKRQKERKKTKHTQACRFTGDSERYIDLKKKFKKKEREKKEGRNKTTSPHRAGMSSTSRLGTGGNFNSLPLQLNGEGNNAS